jgi:hypothetical protein
MKCASTKYGAQTTTTAEVATLVSIEVMADLSSSAIVVEIFLRIISMNFAQIIVENRKIS